MRFLTKVKIRVNIKNKSMPVDKGYILSSSTCILESDGRWVILHQYIVFISNLPFFPCFWPFPSEFLRISQACKFFTPLGPDFAWRLPWQPTLFSYERLCFQRLSILHLDWPALDICLENFSSTGLLATATRLRVLLPIQEQGDDLILYQLLYLTLNRKGILNWWQTNRWWR